MARQFSNPYNFVPFGNIIERQHASQMQGHDGLSSGVGHSGYLHVQMIALTKLALVSRVEGQIQEVALKNPQGRTLFHRVYLKFPENGQGEKIVPASTLKGMLRSASEALSNGCVDIYNGVYRYQHFDPRQRKRDRIRVDHKNALNPIFSHSLCFLTDKRGRFQNEGEGGLCINCRLFGHEGAPHGRTANRKHPESFAGKLTLSDAHLINPESLDTTPIILKELGHPKPHHEPFYLRDGKIRGRKFYYHQIDDKKNYTDPLGEQRAQNISLAQTVNQGGQFNFTIQFQNLTPQELGLLCWAVDLDGSPLQINCLAHKIGLGKPLGLGSVKLRIAELVVFDTAKRYTDFSYQGERYQWKEENFPQKIRELKAGFMVDAFSGRTELTELFTFARSDVAYPDRRLWFRMTNSRTPLPPDGYLMVPEEPKPRRPIEPSPPSVEATQTERQPFKPRPPRPVEDREFELRRRPRPEPRQPSVVQKEVRPPQAPRPPQLETPRPPRAPQQPPAEAPAKNGLLLLRELSRLRDKEKQPEETALKSGMSVRGIIEAIEGDKVTVKFEQTGSGVFQKPMITLKIGDLIKVKIRRVKGDDQPFEVEFNRKL